MMILGKAIVIMRIETYKKLPEQAMEIRQNGFVEEQGFQDEFDETDSRAVHFVLFDGEKPVLENGFGSCIIGGAVELIEVVSTYLSNSISFVRVGAFALAHVVLGFIIAKMTSIAPDSAKIFILVIGNAIVIVLEGMIVAIQVIRLQYYEFFSKFFNE